MSENWSLVVAKFTLHPFTFEDIRRRNLQITPSLLVYDILEHGRPNLWEPKALRSDMASRGLDFDLMGFVEQHETNWKEGQIKEWVEIDVAKLHWLFNVTQHDMLFMVTNRYAFI